MNSNTKKLDPSLNEVLEPKIEPWLPVRSAERIETEPTLNSRLLLPMILASGTRLHGIKELSSPLSE